MASNTAQFTSQLSFAKVAMMSPPLDQRILASHPNTKSAKAISTMPMGTAPVADPSDQQPLPSGDIPSPQMDDLSRGVELLHLSSEKEVSGGLEASGEDGQSKNEGTSDDDQTHLSSSSTKPTSFDSKSMASVTTFAMDEKESLRPDDSASVQAIEEDDFSGSASGAPNSQVGSEGSARLNRVNQLAMAQRFSGMAPTNISRLSEGLKTFHGDSATNPPNERSLHGFPNEPDEKLLEAMRSPKDRLLILQLEEKIIAFIKNPSEQSLELPPCNAFGRLLAHKLGDYYHLTHFVDNNVTSVRLHRTPWCRLPTPLSALYAADAMRTPPPAVPAMKIMRRVGQPGTSISAGGSTAPSSSAPSKATSEAGAEGSGEDGTESSIAATPAKERQTLTREEREAKYQEARERIFRDFPESKPSDSPNSGEHSSNVSRSNSRVGRKKHRQRTPHDDGFEARSQFSTYYGGVQYSSTQIPFGGIVHDASFVPQSSYMLGQPPAAGLNFAQSNQTTSIYPPHANPGVFPQYPVGMATQGNWQNGHMPAAQYANFQQGNQLPMMSQQSSTRSSPAMSSYALPTGIQYPQSPPSWNQSTYQPGYSSPTGQRNSPAVHWPNVPPNSINQTPMTYPYGQSPNQAYSQTPANNGTPNPLPGSFIRSTFNPQSRSFAPGAGIPRHKYSDNVTPSQASSTYPTISQQWIAPQENMNRFPPKGPGPQPNAKSPLPQSSGQGRPADNQNSIAKWGTPSHLPPKPPPSEVPYDFDRMPRTSTVPSQAYTNNTSTLSKPAASKSGPLVVGGAAPQNSRSHGA
ncbi:hypothetical protein D8B26_006795 [Coccidioides posadasii str. Silveira]|uniref:R3H domain-containing protein n=2 Tax=Coccidioides posadasii TaxID=199306 RepID=A0A0J6I9B1_COCPO|nr:hypothetical protein CPC735_034630 [Coccidioides posadasii C735 delta SOWgp]EER28127.1 hypothetical protein CPC735_034630 [Coccidioides posadasii C735 delta SOWgp]KMM68172.1 hypothetical protein CPAG_04503 [Coccidioides posadasii RMSCC 3488]QVM12160.1 hypothetical protein D8B26_006795 [Coccidioides posadasii str. Silveira]|eukprot:XP_003070272.1 hypothetical protein CPC735_034630 [Coccidioides posadasii C735 delta SOWgp]